MSLAAKCLSNLIYNDGLWKINFSPTTLLEWMQIIANILKDASNSWKDLLSPFMNIRNNLAC